MNYYEHHLGDYIKDTVGLLTMVQEGAYRRLLDQYYARELPLPTDLKECHKLARATTAVERAAVDYVVGKFFKRTSDGYRQKRCDEEIERYTEGEPERVEKRENDKERKRRSRERRRDLFEQLRKHGVTPKFDATIAHLEDLLSRVTRPNGHANGHGTGHKKVTPVTAVGTATQSQSPIPDPIPTTENPPQPLPREGRVRGERKRREEPESDWVPPTEEQIRAGN